MKEGFRPVSNTRDESTFGKLKFYGRMLLDLQILSIFRDLKKEVPSFKGNVLDIGCGQSPYRFMLNPTITKYFGIDIIDAEKFDYDNSDITPFNGKDIPFPDSTFDAILCTEVLEHVEHYQALVNEMHRVMKPGAIGIVTIPWSARFHYIPWDYFRYTPSALKSIFGGFQEAKITNRGTDLAVIGNKVIVLFFRNLLPSQLWKWIFVPFWVLLLPILGIVVLVAHLSMLFNWGTDEDPLGYTIRIKK
ncbi:MAG: class I SAM-dependent methyltransferase [Bacteroidia bacterium]|jgi:ubiquinone/menaquinone biosynthesis C-methylase UbiE|nr:MAG: class I SAM-dependent methyltransferase [Bacteroidia bacterium]